MFSSYGSTSGSDHVARQNATSAKSDAREAKTEVGFLKSELERQLMVSEALWEFIKKEHGYKDQDLFDKVIEIDAKDGKIDGRVAPSGPKKCPECNHTLPRRKPFCIYCGIKITKDCFER